MYFPETIFKNILDFCGEPLPPNKNYCVGFNCNKTEVFYRGKNGKIYSHHIQQLVKCNICKSKYLDTGYPNCGKCYTLMNDLSLERKCLDCDIKFKPKFKFCWKCVKCYYKNKKSNCCLFDSDSDED